MNVHPQPPSAGDIRESFLLAEQESPLDSIMSTGTLDKIRIF